MIFEGFENPFSQSKSIKNRFQVELAMKCAPRRPRDVSRRPQDAPKTPQDSQDGPKMRPRRPPGAENFGLNNGFFADPSTDAPKTPQKVPRMPQRHPKRRPRALQDVPRAPQDRPTRRKRHGCPQDAQEAPKKPRVAPKTTPNVAANAETST